MTMPCRWHDGGLTDFTGKVQFVRRFGIPRRIDAHERVWLTFAGAATTADVWLNDQLLGRHEGASEPFEFEITPLLLPHNKLRVEVEGAAPDGGLWGEVALEVRCTAFLRGVRVWGTANDRVARLHASGEIVGSADRPLELYMLLDGSTVAYQTFAAQPAGAPFQLESEELSVERWQSPGSHPARLDLVNGASMWYQCEQAVCWKSGEPGT
jgi:hypothetical protein